jgi:hypothetical protein
VPLKERTTKFFDELGEFVLALTRHWVAFVSGNVVMALVLMLYERFHKPIPNTYYVVMLVVGFVVAGYAAWLEEHRKHAESKGPRPEIAIRWIHDGDDDSKPLVKFYNGGSTDAYNVEAVIWINEAFAIRFESIERIASHDDFVWTPILDNGPRQPAKSQRHIVAFIRAAMGLQTPEARELRRHLRQAEELHRLMTFEPRPPDLIAKFSIAYTDFDGKAYSTPHVLTYVDDTEEIRIRLAIGTESRVDVDQAKST